MNKVNIESLHDECDEILYLNTCTDHIPQIPETYNNVANDGKW